MRAPSRPVDHPRLPRRVRGPLIALAAACCLALPACGTTNSDSASSSSGSPSVTSGHKSVAFVTAAVNLSGYQVMKCAATAAAKKAGLGLTWQGTPSTAPSDEMAVLQGVLARKPDGVILIPWDSNAFVAPVKQLMAKGTPVVTADGSLSKPVETANVRTDNVAAGRQAARALGQRLNGKGSVAILTATPGDAVQNQRWQGFRQTLEANYPDIDVLPVQYVGADTAKATSVASSVLSSHPDVGAFYATQDAGVNGAAAALRAAGRTGKVEIVGWDATPQTVRLLKDGTISGLVSQDFVEEGRRMMETMAATLKDPGAKPKHQIYTSTKYLTKANVDDPSSRDYIYVPQC